MQGAGCRVRDAGCRKEIEFGLFCDITGLLMGWSYSLANHDLPKDLPGRAQRAKKTDEK
jgi:hypothetical protein